MPHKIKRRFTIFVYSIYGLRDTRRPSLTVTTEAESPELKREFRNINNSSKKSSKMVLLSWLLLKNIY